MPLFIVTIISEQHLFLHRVNSGPGVLPNTLTVKRLNPAYMCQKSSILSHIKDIKEIPWNQDEWLDNKKL